MVLPVAMKSNSFLTTLIFIFALASFAVIQTDEELTEARKQVMELIGNIPVLPECMNSGDIHEQAIFFPEGPDSELYAYNNSLGHAYFRIENDKAMLI